jgi:hypothetical protein
MLADSLSSSSSPLVFPSYFNCFCSLLLSGLYLFSLLSPHWGSSNLKAYDIGFFHYCSPDSESIPPSTLCSYSSPSSVVSSLHYCVSSSSTCDTIQLFISIARPALIILTACQCLAASFYSLSLLLSSRLTLISYNYFVTFGYLFSYLSALVAAALFGLSVDLFEQQFDSTFQLDYASWMILGGSFGSLASGIAGQVWNKAKVKEPNIQFDSDYMPFR